MSLLMSAVKGEPNIFYRLNRSVVSSLFLRRGRASSLQFPLGVACYRLAAGHVTGHMVCCGTRHVEKEELIQDTGVYLGHRLSSPVSPRVRHVRDVVFTFFNAEHICRCSYCRPAILHEPEK